MTISPFLRRALALLAASGFGTSAMAQGDAYPTRPVRMIAPSGAGGPVDVVARVVAQGMSDALGQQVVVENRVGAAGLIGAEFVVKSAPDGYTLLFGFSGPLAIVPNLNPRTPYDPQRDLIAITQVAAGPYVLLVHPSVPAKNVKELAAVAKARPGKMSFGSGGVGVGIHMAGELFKLAAGVNILHVPYKGAAPAMTALMTGEVDMMFNGLSAALPFIRNGRVRALAVGGETPSPLLPDLPTVKSAGFEFNTEGWYGVLAPRGTPTAVIKRLHEAGQRAVANQDVKTTLSRMAVETVGSSPADFAAKIARENAVWARVIKSAGLRAK